jgi:biopolymer transport protein ExbD
MLKKSLLSTFVLTLVVINLFLWPYLYKQATSPDNQTDSKEIVVNDVEAKDEVEVEDETPSIEEENINDLDDKGSEDAGDVGIQADDDSAFQVIDIK